MWLLVVCYWLLVMGYWLLVICYLLLLLARLFTIHHPLFTVLQTIRNPNLPNSHVGVIIDSLRRSRLPIYSACNRA
jgi:hypothetical protein